MTDVLTPREIALREDLTREYYALVDLVAGADGRLIIVKGWSVTLSLRLSVWASSSSTTRCSASGRPPPPRSGSSTA